MTRLHGFSGHTASVFGLYCFKIKLAKIKSAQKKMQRSFIAADPHICCRSLLASWFFQRCGGRRFLHDSLFGLLGLAARRSILGQTIWRRQSMRHTLRQVTITTQPQLERSTQPFQATVSLPKKNIRKKSFNTTRNLRASASSSI